VTFCPREKLIGHVTIIGNGNAGIGKGVAAAPRHAYRAQTTVIMGGPAALATDYSSPDGPRLSEPRPRRSRRAFTLDPSGKTNSAEQGAAPYGAHGMHQNLWDNFYGLPPQNGYSMCAVR